MTNGKPKILVLDPQNRLKLDGTVVGNQRDFLARLREDTFDCAVVTNIEDLRLPLTKFLRNVAHRAPLMPIMLISDNIEPGLRGLVDAILPVDVDKKSVISTINKILSRREILAECGLVGRSEAIYAIADVIVRVAPTDIPVLIIGESGTGKELVAKALHKRSKRSDGPFLPVNCGAIPETLIESQLFGYKKGAFTGAAKDTPGFIEKADGGTLFLDEVAEIPLSSQVKLLRFLETGEYFPVGSATPKHADVRIIAATNRELTIMMRQGKFREDLYYRINGVKIFIPPLRERPEDIVILIFYFAQKIAEKHGIKFAGISDDALEAMMSYHWPGNVRELRNLVENMVLLAGNRKIKLDDIKHYFAEHQAIGRPLPILHTAEAPSSEVMREILYILRENNRILREISERISSTADIKSAEREAIINALRLAGGSRKKAAQLLGISTRTLYRKMKKYSIN